MKLNTKNKSLKHLLFVAITLLALFTSGTGLNLKSTENSLSLKENLASTEAVVSENLFESEAEAETDAEKKKKKKARVTKNKAQAQALTRTLAAPAAPAAGAAAGGKAGNSTNGSNATNATIRSNIFNQLNDTVSHQQLNVFKKKFRDFNYKLLGKQIEDIFQTMKIFDSKTLTERGDRAYMEIFVNEFQNCDKDESNDLNKTEFENCTKSDPYLKGLTPPPAVFASQKNLTDPKIFYETIFDSLDIYNTTTMNFHAYMELRLMLFSWKHCSVSAPFLDEISWECAIEIVSGMKTTSRNSLRNIFYMALEISGGSHLRNLDFISFMYFAQGMRTFGKINGKNDHDISRNEFNLALDENILPRRYNQELVDVFFRLVTTPNHPDAGIDLRTFIYYDFAFRLYDLQAKTVPWKLNLAEFQKVIEAELFPTKIFREIYSLPIFNLTKESYDMYQYLNISNFHKEDDFFLGVKFLEKSNGQGSNALTGKKNHQSKYTLNRIMSSPVASGTKPNMTAICEKIFDLIDLNSDGLIDYYDFGHFIQVSYIFEKHDVNSKGALLIGDAVEKFMNWNEFPSVSHTFKERAKRLSLLNQDDYINLFNTLIILSIDDITQLYERKSDPSVLFEIELKRIFMKLSLNYVKEEALNKCIRGIDARKNLPKYDWECAVMEGVQQNIQYDDNASALNTKNEFKLDIVNTVFHQTNSNATRFF